MRAWKLILMCVVFTFLALWGNLALFFDPVAFTSAKLPGEAIDLSGLSVHHKDGACLRYGEAPAMTDAALSELIDALEAKGLAADVPGHVSTWLAWSLEDERVRHGPLGADEVRDLFCAGAERWDCFVAGFQAEALVAPVERARADRVSPSSTPAELEPALRAIRQPRRVELGSAKNARRLVELSAAEE